MELKMSKTWKRVISFVLAFAMAFSFTPVTTSLAATDSATIQIDGKDVKLNAPADKKYDGDASNAATLNIDVTSAGVMGEYKACAVAITYSKEGSSTVLDEAPTDAGNYTATARITRAADADHDVAAVDQTLTAKFTISKRVITISGKDYTRTYNGKSPKKVAEYTQGGANADAQAANQWAHDGGIVLEYTQTGEGLAPNNVLDVVMAIEDAKADANEYPGYAISVNVRGIYESDAQNAADVTANYDITTVNGSLIINRDTTAVANPTVGAGEVTLKLNGKNRTATVAASVNSGATLPGVTVAPADTATVTYYVAGISADLTDENVAIDNDDFPTEAPADATFGDLTSKPVGFYKVFYKAVPVNNYKFAGSNENLATGSYLVAVKQVAGGGNLTVSLADWTYGDKANAPVVSGLAEEVNLAEDVAYTYYADRAMTTAAAKNAKGDLDTSIVPSEAGTYYVKAVVTYQEIEPEEAYNKFTINPKAVKLFVKQPIEMASNDDGDTVVADLNADPAKWSECVNVQEVSTAAYDASTSALVGSDKVTDFFDVVLEYVEGTETVSENVTFDTVNTKAKAPEGRGANYVIAATDGFNAGVVVRNTVSLATSITTVADPQTEWENKDYRPSFVTAGKADGFVWVGNEKLEKDKDYTIAYDTYAGDPLDTLDESLLGGNPVASVREVGVYAMILTAKEGSTKVTAGTKHIILFEITKIKLYAIGITTAEKTYDGKDDVVLSKSEADIFEKKNPGPDDKPTKVVSIDDVVLIGTVVNADESETVTRSDVDAEVKASAKRAYGVSTVDPKNIAIEIPKNNPAFVNYEVVVPDDAVINTKINAKPITVDFANKDTTKVYGQSDADVIEYKLADVADNAIAAEDLVNENEVTITPTEYLSKLGIQTKRDLDANATNENVTQTGMKVVFKEDAVLNDYNNSAIKYTIKYKKDAYTTLNIVARSLKDENVKAWLTYDGYGAINTAKTAYELEDGETFKDMTKLKANVNLYGTATGFNPSDEKASVDIVFYKALADKKTADTSASGQINLNDVAKLGEGYYVARVMPRTGVTNLTEYVDLPFDITGKKITVVLTQTEAHADDIVYSKDSKALNRNVFEAKAFYGGVQVAEGYDNIFRFPNNLSLELETYGASADVTANTAAEKIAAADRSVVGTLKNGATTIDLSNDIPADVVNEIVVTALRNKENKARPLRVIINPVYVNQGTESISDVKIATTDVALDPDTPNKLTTIAARWTYGDEPEALSVSGYVDELNNKGENRKVRYYYFALGTANGEEGVNTVAEIQAKDAANKAAIKAIVENQALSEKERQAALRAYINTNYDATYVGAENEAYGSGEDGVPTYAGNYAVIGIVSASPNYTAIMTAPQLVIIDPTPLQIKAKAGSKYYLENMTANAGLDGKAMPAELDGVNADDLRGEEAKEYAKLTRSKEKRDFLNGLIANKTLRVVEDKDVAAELLKVVNVATEGAGEYDIIPGDAFALDGNPDVYASVSNNYKIDFVSAKYTINPIDLAGENVTVTYLNDAGNKVLFVGHAGGDGYVAERHFESANLATYNPNKKQDPTLYPNGIIVADNAGHYPIALVSVKFSDANNGYTKYLTNGVDYNLVYKNASGSEVTIPKAIGKYTIGISGVAKKTENINTQANFEISNTILEFAFKLKKDAVFTYGDESYSVVLDWDNIVLTDPNGSRVLGAADAGADIKKADAKILKDLKEAIGEDTEFALSFQESDENAGNAGKHMMLVDVSAIEAAIGDTYALDYDLTAKVGEENVAATEVTIAQKALSAATVVEATGFDKTNITYVPDGVKIDKNVWLEDGELLVPEHDYVCDYTNNTAIGTATLTFNADKVASSNYKGTVTYDFDIKVGTLENAVIEAVPQWYSGVEQSINWNNTKVYIVTGKDADGKDEKVYLTKDVDFVVVDDPAFPAKGTKIGDYKVKIQGTGNFDDKTFAEGVFQIIAKQLKVTGVTVKNKVYDGTTTLEMEGVAVLDEEARSLGWSIKKQPTAAVASSKNAGTQTVQLTGFELDNEKAELAAQADQYVVIPCVGTQPLTVEIAAKELSEFTGLELASKEYDGKKTMTLEGTAKLVGAIDDDDISLTGFEESYEADTAEAGIKTIKVDPAKIDLAGEAKINYTYKKPSTIELVGEITKKAVRVEGLSLKEKTYDGKAEAELDGTAAIIGVVAGESVTFDPAERTVKIDSADAGERSFKISKEEIQAGLKGETKDNYVVAEDVTVTGKINPAEVTIEGDIKLADKEYDGIATMTVDASAATLNGVIDAEKNDVKIDVASQYAVANSDAGEKTAKIEVKLTGDKAKNYVLKNAEYEAKGKITPKVVKASGITLKKRVYDQTTTMTVDGTNAKLEGLLAADEGKVTLAFPETVEVADKNAGTKKATVKVALTQSANNYVLEKDEFEVTGTITKKGVTLADMKFKDKYYDGSKYMILTSTKGVITGGVLDGDDVAFETKQNNYVITGTKNAGSKKRKLTRGLWNVTGKDAANYQVAAGPTATGTIKKITVKKVTLKATSVKYTGKAQKPVIKSIVGDNGSKILQKNCKVQYYRNGKTTTDFKSKGTITVKVTGVGSADAKIGRNWTGSVSVKYTIK